ncbi:DUF4402 domain-containing protein [Erythrobacter litoralis]|uniref:DUF4402 domain-containing protein n=1 Tax=Erythrobacter litoralis (strain HTCC2594) TaxID=314225 RepID=Q2NCB1_ERYLH|nr:DUF4402 domain-containing protein [Erythrobacter litoralis]ABC62680.1 hypothetical protein ELI_02940 [Erythrobacter litoralis HTCC2594]
MGLVLATAMSAAPALAQDASTQGSASVAIAEPLSITKVRDLDFGQIIPNGTGIARVRINSSNGNRSANANATLIGTRGDRATFTVVGEPRTQVNLSVAGPVISLSGPGATITVDRLRASRNNGGQRSLPRTFRIPRSGSMTIGFGGRLNAAPDQAPGIYSGDFELTVVYQ